MQLWVENSATLGIEKCKLGWQIVHFTMVKHRKVGPKRCMKKLGKVQIMVVNSAALGIEKCKLGW